MTRRTIDDCCCYELVLRPLMRRGDIGRCQGLGSQNDNGKPHIVNMLAVASRGKDSHAGGPKVGMCITIKLRSGVTLVNVLLCKRTG